MVKLNVLPVAVATIMLLAVVSGAGVVMAKESTAALTPSEQLSQGLGFVIAALHKIWQSKMNPTLGLMPGQMDLTQPITMINNAASFATSTAQQVGVDISQPMTMVTDTATQLVGQSFSNIG